jgi:hypothetical protein
LIKEENLNRCEAYRRGKCLFGCDAIAENFYNSEEALQNNYFDYYLNKKECDTLKMCRKKGVTND